MQDEIQQIQKQLDKIMDNELVHIRGEISELHNKVSELRTDVGVIKTDVAWIKQFTWLVLTSSIGGLIMGILSFILKR